MIGKLEDSGSAPKAPKTFNSFLPFPPLACKKKTKPPNHANFPGSEHPWWKILNTGTDFDTHVLPKRSSCTATFEMGDWWKFQLLIECPWFYVIFFAGKKNDSSRSTRSCNSFRSHSGTLLALHLPFRPANVYFSQFFSEASDSKAILLLRHFSWMFTHSQCVPTGKFSFDKNAKTGPLTHRNPTIPLPPRVKIYW